MRPFGRASFEAAASWDRPLTRSKRALSTEAAEIRGISVNIGWSVPKTRREAENALVTALVRLRSSWLIRYRQCLAANGAYHGQLREMIYASLAPGRGPWRV